MTDNILTRVSSIEGRILEDAERDDKRNADIYSRLLRIEQEVGLIPRNDPPMAGSGGSSKIHDPGNSCHPSEFVTGLSLVGQPILAQGAEPDWAGALRKNVEQIRRELAERRAGIDEIVEEALRDDDAPKRRGRPPGSRNRARATR